jgi:hypothetical protein
VAHIVLGGSNEEFARPIGDWLHGLDSVYQEIDDHLLQLNPVTGNLG